MSATLGLSDKIIIVSGGTQGVGLAIARAAAAVGASVVITGRRPERGEAAVRGLREAGADDAIYCKSDVSDVTSSRAVVAEVVQRFGRVDGLVNAAALTSRGTLLDTTEELFDAHVAANLRGPFFLMQAVVADLVQRGAAGSIVNIITMSALGGQPYLAPYAATKAGLIGLTKNVAHAHRFDKIRVNGINLGWTRTEGEDEIQHRFHGAADDWAERAAAELPMGQLIHPDEVARLVVLLLSPDSGVVTGSIINWDQQVPGAHD